MKTAFIGHRNVYAKNIEENLLQAIQAEIDNGCTTFTMGTHGKFDSLALSACRKLRRTYENLKIDVVITSLNAIKRDKEFNDNPFDDVTTVMYDIEETHYKQQITLSNRKMIDESDTLICYVDKSAYRSGAKTALRYAEKRGLKIVNLYREEDQPFYGMTEEQAEEHWNKLCERVLGRKQKDRD